MATEHSNGLTVSKGKLLTVVQTTGKIIRIEDVAKVLSINRSEAAKTLARWTQQSWLRRIEPGVYVAAPLDALNSQYVLEDPWILVPALFSPAYIGGRTAAEYWDLTEQIFRDVAVFTSQRVRKKSIIRHGITFSLCHNPPQKMFGTQSIWRANTKVLISDVHRTIIDMLDNPAANGGIAHVYDCLLVYLKRPDRDDAKLIDYANRMNNGAIFKRLGFLIEKSKDKSGLAEICNKHLTTGYAKLDTTMTCPRLISKWRLWILPEWENHD